jgi:putative transposase
MAKRKAQLALLKDLPKAYGGELLKKRAGRVRGRPLDSRNTMHLSLRSSRARGDWSFWKHKTEITGILRKFSGKYGIRILSFANVGNHLHIHLKLGSIHTYRPFIRAITSAIVSVVTGANRWHPLKAKPNDHFWDYRPFSRVVIGFRAFLHLREYIRINELEGFGVGRAEARFFLAGGKLKLSDSG